MREIISKKAVVLSSLFRIWFYWCINPLWQRWVTSSNIYDCRHRHIYCLRLLSSLLSNRKYPLELLEQCVCFHCNELKIRILTMKDSAKCKVCAVGHAYCESPKQHSECHFVSVRLASGSNCLWWRILLLSIYSKCLSVCSNIIDFRASVAIYPRWNVSVGGRWRKCPSLYLVW